METVGFGPILALALLAGGINTNDLVSIIEPAAYFKAQRVEPSIDRMIDFAIAEPKTPKAQVQQLVALRHLADQAAAFKAAQNYETNRLALEEIVQGKRGHDAQGFAKEYAERVLARLDGKKEAAKRIPLRKHAFDWFPADTNLGYAIDLADSVTGKADLVADLLKLAPEREKLALYEKIELVGNVRVEHFALGIVDAEQRDDVKVFLRVHGKVNSAWMTGLIQSFASPNFAVSKSKAADGTPVTIMQQPNEGPLLAFIGDTDLVIVGYSKMLARHEDLLSELLEVRAKKKPSAQAGKLKAGLAKLPDKAMTILTGELPTQAKKELGAMFNPLPTSISGYVERAEAGLEVKLEATLANAADAGKVVQKVIEVRKLGVAGLQEAMKQPLEPGAPPVPFQSLVNLMEAVQVQQKGDAVQTRLLVPNTLIRELNRIGVMWSTRPAPLVPFDF